MTIIDQLLAQDKIKEAIEVLLSAPGLSGDMTLVSGRYHGNERRLNQGLIKTDDHTLELNRIKSSIQYHAKQVAEWLPQANQAPPEHPKENKMALHTQRQMIEEIIKQVRFNSKLKDLKATANDLLKEVVDYQNKANIDQFFDAGEEQKGEISKRVMAFAMYANQKINSDKKIKVAEVKKQMLAVEDNLTQESMLAVANSLIGLDKKHSNLITELKALDGDLALQGFASQLFDIVESL